LTHVGSGENSLTARASSWAPSESLEVEVKPGVKIGDPVLKLRRGGVIAGTVYDTEGLEESGVEVWIQTGNGEFLSSLRTKADGHFETERLPPGTYQVLRPTVREDGILDADRQASADKIPVTVVEGQVTSVVLGRPK